MFANLMKGKKTYTAAAALLALAVAQYFGVTVPEEAWLALGALGLGSLRNAIDK